MNVLVIGSGGREHALVWKISQSSKLSSLHVAPGNAGTASIANNHNLNISDFKEIGTFCINNKVELVVVGPEAPLVDGIVDFFNSNESLKHIKLVGPDKNAAQLEGSKAFAKEFMAEFDIPTAAYKQFENEQLDEASAFLETLTAPYVLKADGLAAGKGVVILDDLESAKTELAEMLDGKFGAASSKVVIEEFLDGMEFSVFVLTDGQDYKILPVAKDYKRIGEGDTGLNTGGMGAVSPVSFVDDELMNKVKTRIVEPTIRGIKKRRFDYKGFVFLGLIAVNGEPMVIEYNVRMGDPETEVVIPRVEGDFLEALEAAANQNLAAVSLKEADQYCTTVMAVSEGYPGAYAKGKEITGLENIKDAIPFHAGTKIEEGKVISNGGRVIALSAMGSTQKEALQKSYNAAKTICFEGIQYRNDIGYDL